MGSLYLLSGALWTPLLGIRLSSIEAFFHVFFRPNFPIFSSFLRYYPCLISSWIFLIIFFSYLSHEICSKYDKKSIAIPFIEPFRIRSRDWEEFDLFVTRDECFDHNFWPRSKRLSLMLMTHDDKQIWKKYNVWYATSHGRVLIGSLIILERRFISLHRVHFSFFSAPRRN